MKPYYNTKFGSIYNGDVVDVLSKLPTQSVNCCVTSPPYWGLRDYGVDGQLGLENTPEEYVENIVAVFQEIKRVLRDDGTLWLNLGDSYNGSGGAGGDYSKGGLKEGQPKYPGRKIATLKPKDLVGIPWRVAFALQAESWYLRQDIIWHKPNPMPESVTDRCTKAHEYIFLLSKSQKYFYDHEAVMEPIQPGIRKRWHGEIKPSNQKRNNDHVYPQGIAKNTLHTIKSGGIFDHLPGRNRRSVWTVATKPFKDAHFAVFPPKLIEPCILAGCPKGGTVLDPFFGSGTTGLVAYKHDRKFIGIDINSEYCAMASNRIKKATAQLKLFSA